MSRQPAGVGTSATRSTIATRRSADDSSASVSNATPSSERASTPPPDEPADGMAALLDRIVEHLHEPLTVDVLARRAGCRRGTTPSAHRDPFRTDPV